jgi:hypothetical protein
MDPAAAMVARRATHRNRNMMRSWDWKKTGRILLELKETEVRIPDFDTVLY